MNASWFILFNLYLALWLLMYLLFFSKSSWFKMSRFVLLSGIFWAFVLPWAHFPGGISNNLAVAAPSAISSVSAMPGMVQGIQPMTSMHSVLLFPVWHVVVILYWSGVVVMGMLFLMKLIRLYSFTKKYPRHHEDDHVRVITQLPHEIFSFGRYLFAPDNTPDAILQHELNHIRSRHTIDSLILEVMKIFCWFNPAVYLYAKAVKTLHEYMADARASATIEKEAYAKMLAYYVFRVPGIGFTDHFYNHSQLQKRIIMLQKQNSSRNAGRKYLLIAPLLAALTVISLSSFTLKNKVSGIIISLSPTAQQFNVKGVVTDQYGKPISKATIIVYGTQMGTLTNNNGHFSLKNVPNNGMLVISMVGYTTISVNVNSEKALYLTLYSSPAHLSPVVVVGYSTGTLKPSSKASNGKPFVFVEQMASFPGGKEALLKFLHDNIRYPQEARKEFIQGTVIVSFTVDQDGSLSEIRTINDSLGGGLEQEAIRLIKAMPKWIPGIQNGEKEAVPYTLPIRFILQDGGSPQDVQ